MSLKLNKYVQNTSIINNDIEKITLRFIFWSFGILALLYILFLGNMVKNIVERKSFEMQARSLSVEVGNLQLSYLSMASSVDLALSYKMGFKETKTIFATRKPLGLNQNKSLDNEKIAQNDL